MKTKRILFFALFGLFTFASCEKNKSKAEDQQLSTTEIQEIQEIEKENETFDQIQNEIKANAEELDALLNEIDQ